MQPEDIKHKKINYLLCNQGDLHEGEQLNYVFIDSKVHQSVLMCPVCKSQSGDKKQRIIPLKIFLAETSVNLLTKPISSQSDQLSSQIDAIHQKMLESLRDSVQKMAVQIKEMEDLINNNFKLIKQRMIDQCNTSQNFPLIFENILNNNYDNVNTLKQDVFRIMENIVFTDGKFEVQFKPQKVIEHYNKTLVGFTTAINLSNTNFKGSMVKVQKTLEKIVPAKNAVSFMIPFSHTLKSPQIIINGTFGTVATSIAMNEILPLLDQKLHCALIEPALDIASKSRFTIKVIKKAHWIGVGICFSKIMIGNNYKFNLEAGQLGHGLYLMSSTGKSWSDSDTLDNAVTKAFDFTEGDTIIFEYHPVAKFVLFQKLGKKEKVVLPVISVKDLSDLYACICLGGTGDSVEIIQNHLDEEKYF